MSEGMDAWIDTYHAVRSLTKKGTFVFLTDSAVGAQEEDNLRHLVTNLGQDVPRDRIVPFLTTKHSIEYCLRYAERARQTGFPALVVLGGDKSVGTPRCVPHAWELRRMIRQQDPAIVLGGWANPHAGGRHQADYLSRADYFASFYLTQVVSHHDLEVVSDFIEKTRGITDQTSGVLIPAVFGVFFYRSANARTLATLGGFMPVPSEGLTREFAEGLSAVDICARSLRELSAAGARHFYISNLPIHRASAVLKSILEKAGLSGAAAT